MHADDQSTEEALDISCIVRHVLNLHASNALYALLRPEPNAIMSNLHSLTSEWLSTAVSFSGISCHAILHKQDITHHRAGHQGGRHGKLLRGRDQGALRMY